MMHQADAKSESSVAKVGLAALGVVFGDIGTSPLYTLKTVLDVSAVGLPCPNPRT